MLQLPVVMSQLCTIIWKQIYAARWSLLIFRSVIQRSRWLVKGQACSPTLGEGAYLWYKHLFFNRPKHVEWTLEYKRGSRRGGPGVRTPPPLRFVRGGETLLVGEGVQRLFLPSYYLFFLARFARQYYTNILHVIILPSSICSMERSSFLYISLIKFMKRIQLPIPWLLFWKDIFIFVSCL